MCRFKHAAESYNTMWTYYVAVAEEKNNKRNLQHYDKHSTKKK